MTLDTQASTMLTGTPSVVAYFDLLASEGAGIMRKALEHAAENELEELQSAAEKNQEWSHIADEFTVEVRKNHLVYKLNSKEAAITAKALEFGTPNHAPQPLIRKRLLSADHRFTAAVEEYLGSVL